LVPLYYAEYRCSEHTASIREANGALVGYYGTGDVACYETGDITMRTVLLRNDGDLVWIGEAKCNPGSTCDREYQHAEAAVADMFRGLPPTERLSMQAAFVSPKFSVMSAGGQAARQRRTAARRRPSLPR
jgi:hypothetical protein